MTDKMQQILSQAAAKGGPWAIVTLAFGFVIWQFMLIPMENSRVANEKERMLLVQILQKNATENRRVVAELSDHMGKLVIINRDTRRVLTNFTDSVSSGDHPEQSRKLNMIINILEKR